MQQVAREWRRAGKLRVGPEATGREDDRGFWDEVERRLAAAPSQGRSAPR